MSDPLISLNCIVKDFISSAGLIMPVLKGISFDIAAGEYVAIMGPSGSGKSTLLNILGYLERPSGGHYTLNGKTAYKLKDEDITSIRSNSIGFVFQSFLLLPQHTALQNVMLPMQYAGKEKNVLTRAEVLLERVGLSEHKHKRPSQMSGGQQQRVAIARALANQPSLILADEPTGNLDNATTKEILTLFQELNDTEKVTIVMVTHDEKVARHAGRLMICVDGNLHYDGTVEAGLGVVR